MADIRQVLNSVASSVYDAMQNPFGLNFEIHNNNIYIPLGSAINCLGYNDHLERAIGIARIAFSLFALANSQVQGTNQSPKERVIIVLQVARGMMEMMGNFEYYLLLADAAFTLYNIGSRVIYGNSSSSQAERAGPRVAGGYSPQQLHNGPPRVAEKSAPNAAYVAPLREAPEPSSL